MSGSYKEKLIPDHIIEKFSLEDLSIMLENGIISSIQLSHEKFGLIMDFIARREPEATK